MAKSLYSAYTAAGKSAGQYKASLSETSDWADKFDFIGKQTAWEQEKTSRLVETVGDTLSLISTVGGGYKDKQKAQSRAESLEGKYGDLQKDTRDPKQKGMDWLMGKEQTYTFGEGKTATTLSKAAVEPQGAIAMGESMLGEYQDKFYGDKEHSDFEPPEFSKNIAAGISRLGVKSPVPNLATTPVSTTGTNIGNINTGDNFWFTDEESADIKNWQY